MSRDYKDERIVIYSSYIDKRLTRRLGRRVPLELAVDNPRIEDIYRAAVELGLDPIIEEDKSYPRTWYRARGRILVRKIESKSRIIKMVSQRVKEMYRRKY